MCYQLILLVCFLENMSDQRGPICGGISEELQGENLQEALNLLEKSLANLASGDGPEFKWAIICLFYETQHSCLTILSLSAELSK